MKIVHLSTRELTYLSTSDFVPTAVALLVRSAEPMGNDSHALAINHGIAEQLRSLLTDQLIKQGFETGYELNTEGKLLEELIDRFMREQFENE